MTTSRLRIIGGRWKRRNLEFRDSPEIRPTPNRVRETLFNWLASRIEGAACLDLFAGSGALGFEAVSRNAASARLVESERRTCAQLESEVRRFGAKEIRITRADARVFVRQARSAYDVIFLDPPFGRGLVEETMTGILNNSQLLSPTSLVYVERESAVAPPAGWDVLREGRTSEVWYALFGKNPL